MKMTICPAYQLVPAIFLLLLFSGACKMQSSDFIPQWFIDRGLSGIVSWESSTGTLRITA